jgi:hypothetical protein
MTCDLYNVALEDLLRIVNARGELRPGKTYALDCEDHRFDVRVAMRGLWGEGAFERFEFVSDYQVRGLQHRHVNYGLGVPLIAVRRSDDVEDPASRSTRQGMSVPVTAILRAVERPSARPDQQQIVLVRVGIAGPAGFERRRDRRAFCASGIGSHHAAGLLPG